MNQVWRSRRHRPQIYNGFLLSFLHIGRPWGSLWAPLGSIWVPFGYHLGTLGRHLGIRGIQYRVCLILWAVALDTLGHFSEKGSKKIPKMIEKGTTNGSTFDDILCFCGKWQTAFGLRLCSRIKVRAPCFQPLSLHCCPLFFQCFFDVFWGFLGIPKSGSASEAAPS